HLIFLETNISRLPQLAALAQVRRLDQLTIHPEGNPVVSMALWRSFIIYRLYHFNLQKINGQEVSTGLCFSADHLLYEQCMQRYLYLLEFSHFCHITTTNFNIFYCNLFCKTPTQISA
ncbi:hypothetical protein ILYODFUR_032553, partial [Ilyodon furcidens]